MHRESSNAPVHAAITKLVTSKFLVGQYLCVSNTQFVGKVQTREEDSPIFSIMNI